MSIVIGVDAGGTKTTVLVGRGDTIITRNTGASGAVRPGRALQAASRIAIAVRKALTEASLLEADVLVVGAAGVGREPEQSELRDALRNERLAARVLVLGDLDIALEAAFGDGPGIVLVSGTGSVAVARGPDGTVRRRGGLGWQMGDEGSGYAIGRAAMHAVGRAHDGRGPGTALTEALLGAGPSKSFDALVRWSTSVDPGEIAALAPAVFAAAAAGDGVAGAIVEAAADELCGLVGALLPAGGSGPPAAVALAGGNLAPGRALRDPVITRLRADPRLRVVEAPFDPVEGALALARREAAR